MTVIDPDAIQTSLRQIMADVTLTDSQRIEAARISGHEVEDFPNVTRLTDRSTGLCVDVQCDADDYIDPDEMEPDRDW